MSTVVTPPVGAKACRCCGKVKPLGAFTPRADMRDGRTADCRTCLAIRSGERRRMAAHAAYVAAYLARPDVRERKATQNRRWRESPKGRAAVHAYCASPAGKVRRMRHWTAYLLRKATDPKVIARLTVTIALCDAELARFAANLEAAS